MRPKLQEAQYRRDYRIWLKFDGGIEGEVDLESALWGEVVEPLKDQTQFAASTLNEELETIVWPSGADSAPESLYLKLRSNYTLKPTSKSGAA